MYPLFILFLQLYQDHNYKMARMCFEKAGDTFWKRRSEAAELRAKAHHMRTSNPEMANTMLRRAALIFEAIGLSVSAARCFYDLGEYKRAGMILTSIVFVLPEFMLQ